MKTMAMWGNVAALLCCAAALGAEDDVTRARRLLLSGKYAEARELYAPSAAKDPAAAVGLARAMAAVGKHEEAIKALQGAGSSGEVEAELARLTFDRGDYAAASSHVEAALKANSDQLLARWLQGELHRLAGRLDEAEKSYRWLVDFYNGRDVKEAESLHWIGLAAAQYARWNRLNDQYSFLVNDLYSDAWKAEPGYWPAHYEAGRLFAEKYNQADASREFKTALELNPNAAEVHVAVARLAVERRDIQQAQSSLRRALEIRPDLHDAWLLKADLAWANFQPEEAAGMLEKSVLPLNPVSEEALGRLAACFLLQDGLPQEDRPSRLARLEKEVLGRDPHAGDFYLAAGSWLEDRHRLGEAERFYQEAARLMPRLIGPKTSLGMIAMRAGREVDARKLLEEAFKIDPFNIRTKNSLECLDLLDKYESLEGRQTIIRFDPKHDKLFTQYASRYIEEVYPELCRQFGYQPPQKPLVEVFHEGQGASGHEWFGARMVGLPYVGPVAASTGHIVGMVSPGDPGMKARFNWARVLKHELVHVVTLQQTQFNMPHWFTEGLAVWSEGHPRPQEWNELLARRMAQGKLFDLQTLNFAFTRPQSSDEWLLGYCQAELYVEYMLEGRSPEVLRKLSAAYRENLGTPEAIRRTFGVSLEEFERSYSGFLKRTAPPVSPESLPQEQFHERIKSQREHPDDAALAAEVAYESLRRGANAEAEELARHALKLQPKQVLAIYVLARLDVRANRPQEAIDRLESVLDRNAPDLRILNLLAGLKLKAAKYAEAADLYRLGAKREPQNLQWLRSLARVYVSSKEEGRLPEVLAPLAAADPDDLATRKKLAELALKKRDYRRAADWANQALQIDVLDMETHRALAEALGELREWPRAIEEYEVAVGLAPETPQPRFALADAYIQAGKPREARRALEELLRRHPNYPGADLMLENLKESEKRDR